MRFFTGPWLLGDLFDAAFDAAPAAYRRHIESLDLPPTVRALADLDSHDALILAADRPAPDQLHLRLRCGDLQRGYADTRLTFTGVAIPPEHFAVLAGAVPGGTTILYDEVDRAGLARFEYRLLLDSTADVGFVFRDVVASRDPRGV